MKQELYGLGDRFIADSEKILINSQIICLPGGIVFTCHPEALKLVEGNNVDRKSNGFDCMQELCGGENSVATKYDSDVRKEAKRISMENFNTKGAESIVALMSKKAQEFLDNNLLPSQMTAPEFYNYIARWVTTSTMKGLFGYDIDSNQAAKLSEYARAIFVSSAVADLVGNNRFASRVSKTLGYDGNKAGLELRNTAEDILNTSDAPLVKHLRDVSDEYLSQEQKIAEIAVLIGGSTGNTSHTLTHLLLSLADPSSEQYVEKLRNLDPESDEYKKLMAGAMHETLRMYPAVPFIRREVLKPIKLGDKDIPAGSKLVVSIHSMQRVLENSEATNQFNPTRNVQSWRNSFGWGKRSCSGVQVAVREIPMFAGHFLRKYQAQTNGETQRTIDGFPLVAYNPRINLHLQQFSLA